MLKTAVEEKQVDRLSTTKFNKKYKRQSDCALHMCVTLHVLDGEGSRVFASRAVVAQTAMYLTIYSD